MTISTLSPAYIIPLFGDFGKNDTNNRVWGTG